MYPTDPNDVANQPVWTPPTGAGLGMPPSPADGEPTTSGDRWALIALTVSLSAVLGSCIPGFGCLAPLVAGLVALTQVGKAANPERARTYAWIATGIGILMLLFTIGIIVLYGTMILSAINEL